MRCMSRPLLPGQPPLCHWMTLFGETVTVSKDPFGHNWSMATHMRDVSEEEIREGAKGCA